MLKRFLPILVRSSIFTPPVSSRHFSKPEDERTAERTKFIWPSGNKKYEAEYNKWEALSFDEKLKDLLDERKEYFKEVGSILKEEFIEDQSFRNMKEFEPKDVVPIAEFKSDDDVKKWTLGCDSIWEEGYSTCQLQLRDNNYVTFSGYIDSNNLPTDTKIYRAGWANMTLRETPRVVKDIYSGGFDFTKFTHFRMKCRGDGRRYIIIFGLKGENAMNYGDMFGAWCSTHGGPYWQDVRIPFSKFFFANSGVLQDRQERTELQFSFTHVGISVMDGRTGPFKLDISSLGVEFDPGDYEQCSYEGYTHPAVYLIEP